MRLAKYLASAGVASRRRAETMICEGRVAVNGIIAEKPEVRVNEGDSVTVDGSMIEGPEKKVYLLLNKPQGYISTAYDTHDRQIVTELVADTEARLYPVGRLDADTSGVLLMTNDGELAHRLMHPRFEVEKVYKAWVEGMPQKEAIEKMRCGLIIEGDKTAPARIKLLKRDPANNTALLEITIIEGRKRQVKKMCAAIGHPVRTLRRDSFAGLKTGRLKKGAYRHLDKREVNALYRLVGLQG